MKSRGPWYLVGAVLALVLLLALLLPQPMLSPGPVQQAHRGIGDDCFACHVPFRGSRAERCLGCHALDRIGRFTTTGQPIARTQDAPAFHRQLTRQDCNACHAEHQGAHGPAMPAFSHDLLHADLRGRCTSCHTKPADSLHRDISGSCGQCHDLQRWSPTSFDHAQYFQLDRDHDVACATCHVGGSFERYSCYGCHEHTQAGIRAEHLEEGIRNFENCVECHREAEEPEHGER